MQKAPGGIRKQTIWARSAETLPASKSTILLAPSSTQPCRKLTDESADFLNPTTLNQFKLTGNALPFLVTHGVPSALSCRFADFSSK